MKVTKRKRNAILSYITVAVGALLLMRRQEETQVKKRRWWVHPVNQTRKQLGEFDRLYRDYRNHAEKFFQYFRMEVSAFDYLLERLTPALTKHSMRQPISPQQRLAVTLRFLATGDSFQTIAASGRMGRSTVSMIVKETCKAIWDVLSADFVSVPNEEAQWEAIATEFYEKWQFPNCIGAIDGKHIVMRAPLLSGSQYFNYKKTFSTLLLAVCDANYRFTYIDVGSYGRAGDAGVFGSSTLKEAMDSGTLNIPPPRPLPNAPQPSQPFPFMFIGDEAFPLRPDMMRPYARKDLDQSKRIFNYRLSRARRLIENSFGILAARWRVFRRPIECQPSTVDLIVYAACTLHNFLMSNHRQSYCPDGFVDRESTSGNVVVGEWRSDASGTTGLRDVGRTGSNNPRVIAKNNRDLLKDYFLTPEGSVSWQNQMIKI